MKKFNQVITVEISVDNIAQQLLATWNKSDFPHAEMLTETIIGTALNNETISLIYNNLNGYTNDIDFEVGQVVSCDVEISEYVNKGTEEEPDIQRVSGTMGVCAIINIDTNRRSEKVKVGYTYMGMNLQQKRDERWVSHFKLTKIS
jgi:hypothetical protein